MTELMFPRRSDITVATEPGRQKTRRLFDSTALVASERLAAAMAGTITPSTIQWFDVEVPDIARLIQIPKIIEDHIHGTAAAGWDAISNSNFDTEIQELYHDLNVIGTGALFIDDVKGTPVFRTLHPAEYTIATDSQGRVVKLIRDVKMNLREAVKSFGFENLHPKMRQDIIEGKNLDNEFMFAHWIAKREDEQFGFPVDNFPVASIYVDVLNKHIVRKSGFNEWPVPVARWSTTSGESYGRGPGFTALPDVASLNKAEELALKAWAMAVMPPLLATHDGVLGKPDLRPARMNFVNSLEGSLSWFPPATNLDIETVKREDKRRSIWNIFFMDQVQFVPERGKTPPSAEEVRARLNIMLQILGPTLSRLDHELLRPTLARVFGILGRAGKLPQASQLVTQFARRIGSTLNIQFIGPIARAKRQAESMKLDLALNSLGAALQIEPELVDVVDLDEWIREKYRIEMVPRNIIRDRASVEERRQQRAQLRAQEQQLAQMQQMAEVGGKAAPLAKAANEER